MATTCSAVKIVPRPPRKRWRSSVQLGFGRRPNVVAFVEMARPHSTEAVSSAHPTRPAERATYHGRVTTTSAPAALRLRVVVGERDGRLRGAWLAPDAVVEGRRGRRAVIVDGDLRRGSVRWRRRARRRRT